MAGAKQQRTPARTIGKISGTTITERPRSSAKAARGRKGGPAKTGASRKKSAMKSRY